ncbi:MAG: hypothetical protein HY226_06620 [Candidatus Vogelbacteria bacterium]|nr:hypothetical protein [Candidatus Vogelbacteria bacterium]
MGVNDNDEEARKKRAEKLRKQIKQIVQEGMRREIEAIVARDMPGWNLASYSHPEKDLDGDGYKTESYMVTVQNRNGFTKSCVISLGQVIGSQG